MEATQAMALMSASKGRPTQRLDEPAARERSIPALFSAAARDRGPQTAMRWKRGGIWEAVTWTEYATAVREVGSALTTVGVQRGERVAILAENRPEWLYADLGALCAGCVTVGIDVRAPVERVVDVLNDCRARILFIDSEEQLETALEALPKVATLARVVRFDEQSGPAKVEPRVMSFAAFRADGRAVSDRNAEQGETGGATADDVAAIVYDVAAGPIKATAFSHRDLLRETEAIARLCPGTADDEQLSILPLARADERCFTAYRPLALGSIVNFGEGPGNLVDSLREVAPHVALALPDVWELLHATIAAAIADAAPIGRFGYRVALGVGSAVADHEIAGRRVPVPLRIASLLASHLVLNRARTMIGLRRARVLLSLAAPTSPAISHWYAALGLKIVDAQQQGAGAENAVLDGRVWRPFEASDTLA